MTAWKPQGGIGEGGYDEAYRQCNCFWGTKPASLVQLVPRLYPNPQMRRVLDVGCGDGKNAYFLASKGFKVVGLDISELAIENAIRYWPSLFNLSWEVGDLMDPRAYGSLNWDVVVATGPLHCLPSESGVRSALGLIQASTAEGGTNIISVFNNRKQDLRGHHPDFDPCLLPHEYYLASYSAWEILYSSDKDLIDSHPHTKVVHTHSVTRMLAKRV